MQTSYNLKLKKLTLKLMNRKILILIIILAGTLLGNSRVSFMRPGAFMRASDLERQNQNKLFSITIASEVTSIGDIVSHSSGFAYNKSYMNGTSWGLSYIMLPYTGIDELNQFQTEDEIGFHFQTPIYSSGRSNITGGIQDVLISNDIVNINDLSFFLNFSNTSTSDNYMLTSLLGLGTGKMAFDPHSSVSNISDSSSTLGLYGAFKLNTPFLKQWGGMDVITEFLAQGINIGFVFPITEEYEFSFGITHLENLNQFSNQSASKLEDRSSLIQDAPAFCFGITAHIPKISSQKIKKIAQNYPILFINGRVDSSLYNAGEYIYSLQDSLQILKQEINNVSAENVELQLNNHFYRDSLNNMILQVDINSSTQNEAMRHLSRSLRLYYQGDFQQALTEVDEAIELQPNIAVAYARKGSIYYKLNQIDRATLNWNIALKIDPEYSEVREMLKALKENKLKPVSIDN
jgi:regulator of replication initiation timing